MGVSHYTDHSIRRCQRAGTVILVTAAEAALELFNNRTTSPHFPKPTAEYRHTLMSQVIVS